MVLEAKDIVFGYQKHQPVLDGFCLRAEQNERIALAAPSGVGKTTLCQLLAGYLNPWSGQISLDQKPLPQKGYCPVQMIWQHPEKAVDPYLRMKDTLAEGGDLDSGVLDGLGIESDWLNRFPGELSGGEIQRFCIARALSGQTKYIIADEISTMLDLITQSQIWTFLLTEIKRRNIGLIFVSHSDALTKHIATRKVTLEEQCGGRWGAAAVDA